MKKYELDEAYHENFYEGCSIIGGSVCVNVHDCKSVHYVLKALAVHWMQT